MKIFFVLIQSIVAVTACGQTAFEQKALDYFCENSAKIIGDTAVLIQFTGIASHSFKEDIFLHNRNWHQSGIVQPDSYTLDDIRLNENRDSVYKLKAACAAASMPENYTGIVNTVAVFRRFYYNSFVYVHVQASTPIEGSSTAFNMRALLIKFDNSGKLLDTYRWGGIVN